MDTPKSRSRGEIAAALRRRVAGAAGRRKISAERWAFRKAAALLPWFDPDRLLPAGLDEDPSGARFHLAQDSQVLGESGASVWALRPEVRRETLEKMAGRDSALQALEANPGILSEDLHQAMTAYLHGGAPAVEEQGIEELVRSLRVVRSLSGIPDLELPSEARILAQLDRKRLLQPLRRLLEEPFRGREEEFEQLRRHVGVIAASTSLGRLGDGLTGLRRLFHGGKSRPLLIHGPGGIGKSTLLAKFVIDHYDLPSEDWFPISILDFERQSLTVRDPMSLVMETAYQLAVHYPGHAGAFQEVQERSRKEGARQRKEQERVDDLRGMGTGESEESRKEIRRLRSNRRKRERRLMKALARAVHEVVAGFEEQRPFLIVLDSFEEAQYRSLVATSRLWRLLGYLQEAYPLVRVVISGRAPVKHLRIGGLESEEMPLGAFDEEASTAFLMARTDLPEGEARLLARQFPGVPLTLKLLAKLIREEGYDEKSLRSLPKRSHFFRRVNETVLQAMLYDRVLGHVHSGDIEELIHPGLVLRRITPEIIREFLASRSGIPVPDEQRAEELFEELAEQVDLVEERGSRELIHRPDVRKGMLRLIEMSQPEMMAAIERAAVEYYGDRPGPAARAEEIYHRLRLGEDPEEVDRDRWIPGVEPFLVGAADEMPPRARSFLAGRVEGTRIDLQSFSAGSLEDWEAATARDVRELLDEDLHEEAFRLLGLREERSAGSLLYPLDVEAHLARDDLEAAALKATEGIYSIISNPLPPGQEGKVRRQVLLSLYRYAARFAVADQDYRAADEQLRFAAGLAAELGRAEEHAGLILQRAQLRRTWGLATEQPDPVLAELLAASRGLEDRTLLSNPTLGLGIVREIGSQNPGFVVRILNLFGFESLRAEEIQRLAAAISELAAGSPLWRRWLVGFARDKGLTVGKDLGVELPTAVEELEASGKLKRLALKLAEGSDPGAPLLSVLVDLIRPPRSSSYEGSWEQE